jgi:hypothetical protein
VFYPVMKSVFDIIVQLRINNAPCRMLDETNINIFIEHTKRIEEKKQRIESTVDKNEKTLLEKTLKLLKQETMMELISL